MDDGGAQSPTSLSANIYLISYSELLGLILWHLFSISQTASSYSYVLCKWNGISSKAGWQCLVGPMQFSDWKTGRAEQSRTGFTQTNLNFGRLIGFHWQKETIFWSSNIPFEDANWISMEFMKPKFYADPKFCNFVDNFHPNCCIFHHPFECRRSSGSLTAHPPSTINHNPHHHNHQLSISSPFHTSSLAHSRKKQEEGSQEKTLECQEYIRGPACLDIKEKRLCHDDIMNMVICSSWWLVGRGQFRKIHFPHLMCMRLVDQ